MQTPGRLLVPAPSSVSIWSLQIDILSPEFSEIFKKTLYVSSYGTLQNPFFFQTLQKMKFSIRLFKETIINIISLSHLKGQA